MSRGAPLPATFDTLWVTGSSAGGAHHLACSYDTYGGVVVEPDGVPGDAAEFRRTLAASLAAWRAEGRAGVWLELRATSASLIPIAVDEFGFEFHHAERDFVMLTRWLPEDRPNSLPGNASHTIGVGAFVIDEATESVLLVREQTGPAARLGFWKLPTGLVESGEELHEAAVREVHEETGIEAEFVDIRAFRMGHLGNLAHRGKSNLYFVVKLRVRPGTATEPRPKAGEIAEARWVTLEEFGELPYPVKGSMYDVLNRSAVDARAHLQASEAIWRNTPSWIYYPAPLSSEGA